MTTRRRRILVLVIVAVLIAFAGIVVWHRPAGALPAVGVAWQWLR